MQQEQRIKHSYSSSTHIKERGNNGFLLTSSLALVCHLTVNITVVLCSPSLLQFRPTPPKRTRVYQHRGKTEQTTYLDRYSLPLKCLPKPPRASISRPYVHPYTPQCLITHNLPLKTSPTDISQDTGNKISRRSQIHGTQHIILGGKTVIQAEAVIRGDLYRLPSTAVSTDPNNPPQQPNAPSVAITVGRYSYISKSVILRPPSRLHRGVHSFYPLKIGDHVFVGESAVVEAASLGNHVHVGAGATIGSMAIVKDFSVVLEGAVVPPGMVVPSWCVVGGRPARIVGEVGEGYGVEGAEGGLARERYRLVGRP